MGLHWTKNQCMHTDAHAHGRPRLTDQTIKEHPPTPRTHATQLNNRLCSSAHTMPARFMMRLRAASPHSRHVATARWALQWLTAPVPLMPLGPSGSSWVCCHCLTPQGADGQVPFAATYSTELSCAVLSCTELCSFSVLNPQLPSINPVHAL